MVRVPAWARNSAARVVPMPGRLVTISPSSCSAPTAAMVSSMAVMRSLTASRSVAIWATVTAAVASPATATVCVRAAVRTLAVSALAARTPCWRR